MTKSTPPSIERLRLPKRLSASARRRKIENNYKEWWNSPNYTDPTSSLMRSKEKKHLEREIENSMNNELKDLLTKWFLVGIEDDIRGRMAHNSTRNVKRFYLSRIPTFIWKRIVGRNGCKVKKRNYKFNGIPAKSTYSIHSKTYTHPNFPTLVHQRWFERKHKPNQHTCATRSKLKRLLLNYNTGSNFLSCRMSYAVKLYQLPQQDEDRCYEGGWTEY